MIPFNRPLCVGTELARLEESLQPGPGAAFRTRCEAWFLARTGAAAALMTTSGTHALELAALAAGIGPGDEVILPGYTFVSSANAFLLRGAVPVFVDVRPDTCNVNEDLIEAAVTARTRAILVVHYGGVACEMEAILQVARRYGLLVIEDAAHGVMAGWRGKALGSIGHMGALSFHATKNYTSGGEGGMLLVNEPRFVAPAMMLRAKGTDRDAFLRHEVSRYSWQMVGSNYLPSELQAAYLYAQLEQADAVNDRRTALWRRYAGSLAGVCAGRGIGLPFVPEGCEHNAHIFYLRLPPDLCRNTWIAALAERGVEACSHYTPLHTTPTGIARGRFHGSDEQSLAACENLVRLPLYYALTDVEQEHVIRSVIEVVRSG